MTSPFRPKRTHKTSVFNNVDREGSPFITVLYANVDSGLLNKRDELSVLIQERDPDAMVFNKVLPKRTRQKKIQ